MVDPDFLMPGKTLGEMAPEERAEAIKRAAARLSAELKATAPDIAKVLAETDQSLEEKR